MRWSFTATIASRQVTLACRESSEHMMTTGDVGSSASFLRTQFPQACPRPALVCCGVVPLAQLGLSRTKGMGLASRPCNPHALQLGELTAVAVPACRLCHLCTRLCVEVRS